ncbi:MAG: hypothetical protein JEY97_15060 [Bacteroidales bacterium]|nr:hypothetical protein [Bacteroidales bacterium]
MIINGININIGNTYLEAGNTKSTYGKLSYLRPKSTKAHVENTIKLLLSLKEDKVGTPIYREVTYNFSLNQNIPNPFKPTRFDNSYNLTK